MKHWALTSIGKDGFQEVRAERITAERGGSTLKTNFNVPNYKLGWLFASVHLETKHSQLIPQLFPLEVNWLHGNQENTAWGRFCRAKPKRSCAKQTPDICRSILFCPWQFPVHVWEEQRPLHLFKISSLRSIVEEPLVIWTQTLFYRTLTSTERCVCVHIYIHIYVFLRLSFYIYLCHFKFYLFVEREVSEHISTCK